MPDYIVKDIHIKHGKGKMVKIYGPGDMIQLTKKEADALGGYVEPATQDLDLGGDTGKSAGDPAQLPAGDLGLLPAGDPAQLPAGTLTREELENALLDRGIPFAVENTVEELQELLDKSAAGGTDEDTQELDLGGAGE